MKTQNWGLLTLLVLAFLFSEAVYSIQADHNIVTTQSVG